MNLSKASKRELIKEIQRERQFQWRVEHIFRDEWSIREAIAKGILYTEDYDSDKKESLQLSAPITSMQTVGFLQGVAFAMSSIKQLLYKYKLEDVEKHRYQTFLEELAAHLVRMGIEPQIKKR